MEVAEEAGEEGPVLIPGEWAPEGGQRTVGADGYHDGGENKVLSNCLSPPAVCVYVVSWSEFPIVPSYPHCPQGALSEDAPVLNDEACGAREWEQWVRCGIQTGGHRQASVRRGEDALRRSRCSSHLTASAVARIWHM